MIVHVIGRSRSQFTFPDGATPEQILASLEMKKGMFGFNGHQSGTDKLSGRRMTFDDPKTGFVWDDPKTIVEIGEDDGTGNFRTIKRIKGPPVENRA
jgi:hypothetical protein